VLNHGAQSDRGPCEAPAASGPRRIGTTWFPASRGSLARALDEVCVPPHDPEGAQREGLEARAGLHERRCLRLDGLAEAPQAARVPSPLGIVEGMKIESLDHVALWVRDRDRLADFLTAHLGMHVIDRTDAFTLVGSNARRGKLTLFAAEGERDPGALLRVALRVADLERALASLPPGLEVARPEPGVATFVGPERLGLGLVEAGGDAVEFDLDHVALLVRDRAAAQARLGELGFLAKGGRLAAGDSFVDLVEGDPDEPDRPLLNHLGLRVESAGEHIAEARARGLEIADVVDARNTYAVFVWGPERIKLEYVEHKASFSLV